MKKGVGKVDKIVGDLSNKVNNIFNWVKNIVHISKRDLRQLKKNNKENLL